MIIATEIQQHLNIPFDHYQKMAGYSMSFLKKEQNGIARDFIMTDKVRVGSLVDAILTEPAKANMMDPLYPVARKIAQEMSVKFGDLLKEFIPQVSYTAMLQHGAFNMPARGRLDFLFPKFAVIDLKVTNAKNIEDLIKFMKYKEQMHLYCKFAGVTKAYLFIYCVPLKKCHVEFIDCSGESEWWEDKIINFGTATAQN